MRGRTGSCAIASANPLPRSWRENSGESARRWRRHCATSSKKPEPCTSWSPPVCTLVRSPRSALHCSRCLRATLDDCIVTAILVWGFVWWSGAQLPAVRAATMVTAALAARACGRATFSWNALAMAALVVSFLRPASVATSSFALSFSCVGAIFACAGTFERWIEAHRALPDRGARSARPIARNAARHVAACAAASFLAVHAVRDCRKPRRRAVRRGATMALGAAQLATGMVRPLAQACANSTRGCSRGCSRSSKR